MCEDIKVSCEELKPKYPGYRFYKLELPYSSKGNVFNSRLWPENVLVSKFYFLKFNKDPNTTSSSLNIL